MLVSKNMILTIVGIILALMAYFYCRPIAMPCLPCCEPNCTNIGTFTYCTKGTGPESSMCPTINAMKKAFRALYDTIVTFIGVCKKIITGIISVVKKIFEIIKEIIEIIAAIISPSFNGLKLDSLNSISCKVDLILFSLDPCYACVGAPIKAISQLVNELLMLLLKPIVEVVKGLASIVKAIVGPIISFVIDIVTFILGPFIDLVKNLIYLMGNIVTFFGNIVSVNIFTYMYWKSMWKIKSIFPYIPIELVPIVIALFVYSQFFGGMIGIQKLLYLPINAIRAPLQMKL